MPDAPADYRRYLQPSTLARVTALDLRARFIVEGMMQGQHRSPFQGSSVEFAQHRPYVPGDDTRRVDWKVFGRSDRIYIKQFQEETNLPLLLVVDASESMGFGSQVFDGHPWTKYDHATSIAAALAYLAVNQQDTVGLAVFDTTLRKYLKPSNRAGQWKTLIQEMQQTPRGDKTGTGKVLDQVADKLSHRSLIVLISDLFDDLDSLKSGLRHLRYRKHEIVVLQLLDPQEVDFPFEDVTLFKGLEQAGDLLTEPRALREGYLKQLNDFTDATKKLCRSMNIDFRRFNSGEPLDAALSTFLAERLASMK